MQQRWLFRTIKDENPGVPEELALAQLIVSRFLAAQMTGDDLFDLERSLMADGQSEEEMMAAVLEVMRARELRTLDQVVDAILDEESSLPVNPPMPGYEEVTRQVTLILREGGKTEGHEG